MIRLLLIALITLLAIGLPMAAQDAEDTTSAPEAMTDSAYQEFVLDSIRLEHRAELQKLHAAQPRSIPATEVIGVSIPIVMVIIVFLYLWRLSEAKKAVRVAMIEKGMDPSVLDMPGNENSRKYGALRIGMLLAGIGAGLLVGFVITTALDLWNQEFVPLIIISSALLFGGGGLIAYHKMVDKMENGSKG